MFGRNKQVRYNFTDRVRSVLARAREEAIALKHDYVGTEHMLLALVREPEGVHAAVFMKAKVEPADVRARVLAMVRSGHSTITLGDLPYTSRAKKALELALQSARDLKHSYVGTEHILLGLILEESGIGGQILKSVGLDIFTTRMLVTQLLSGEQAEVGPVSTFRIDIDDASDKSIYEQIIAQVQEAVATGALESGDRLPAVRQLADQLNIAPGTVARAYSELERLKVVVTEGARGTRIADRPGSGAAEHDRAETLAGLMRPVAVAAYHMGASKEELRAALDRGMDGIYE